jgi:threonine synthase
MQFYSLNNHAVTASFRQAAIQGQAPDRGLYFPETIPVFPRQLLEALPDYSQADILYEVMRPYVGEDIPEKELRRICAETVNFPIPLVLVKEGMYALELFHGPTLAFKDVGARFMSRCLGYFMQGENRKVTVLVATSGDTGGAVANGFYEVEGVEVVILYPSGKVSAVQEAQMATLGRNITALEVNGTFDDCQQLVKQAFADEVLQRRLFLTSANSINVARWLPQQCYYLFACRQWNKPVPPVISVPSGNFGNICAGLLARASGLPVTRFVAACNANKVVPDYFDHALYQPQPAVATLSNAMDVGNPSNFIRILELFQHQLGSLKEVVRAASVSDAATINTLQETFTQYGYLCDPHGAVALHALEGVLKEHPGAAGIFLETAHPVKFAEAIAAVTGIQAAVPDAIQDALAQTKHSLPLENDYAALQQYLLS